MYNSTLDFRANAAVLVMRPRSLACVLAFNRVAALSHSSEINFTQSANGVFDQFERTATPNGMGGWSGLAPTQEQVDAYEMANGQTPITGYNSDGSPIINPASGYVETGYTATAHPLGYYPSNVRNMYVNREPRFYATVNYNEAVWRGRRVEFMILGRDGRKTGPDYTPTGYLLRKFSDPMVDVVQGRFTLKTWIFFRLGELYLNYAEALNEESGPVADVYKYVNAIRSRAGLPNLAAGLSKEQMREKIRHERRIELAFETHRYFDTHRWKLSEVVDNRNITGMNVESGRFNQDNSYYIRTVIEKRVFEKKHYLWPIPQVEINKVPTLVQNPGW
jgi:starch-binding outer membrane protein, SusD/RagB family